jgi:hypothetical protein
MKRIIEVGSGFMTYIHTYIHTYSYINTYIQGEYTDREHGDRISLLPFIQNKESRLIKVGLRDHVVCVSVSPLC